MRLLIAERFTPVPSSFSLLFNSSPEEIEDFAKTFRRSIYRFLKLSAFLTADESLTKCSRDYSTKRQDVLVLPRFSPVRCGKVRVEVGCFNA